MNCLVIVNDAPYGSERGYNGLRLADSLAKDETTKVSVFLMGGRSFVCRGRSGHTQRILQYRAHVEISRVEGPKRGGLRFLHGCPRHQAGGACGRRRAEFHG